MNLSVERVLRDGLRAAGPAALLSGLPSTIHGLLSRGDPLEPSLAAGSMLLPNERRPLPLLVAAAPVHLALSAMWAVVLAATLPRKNPIAEGILAGAAIAALDLGVVGRRFPRIRRLQPLPQIADHIAFGVITAVALARQREERPIRA